MKNYNKIATYAITPFKKINLYFYINTLICQLGHCTIVT